MGSFSRSLAVALVILCTTVAVGAQTSSVMGRVTDAQGGAVSGATVTLTGPGAQRLELRTAADGGFTFADVPAGTYTLRVDGEGFATWSQNVTVAAVPASLMVTLRVAGLSEAISVVGVAPATLATPTLTATRLGLTPLDTPASVSIISGQLIRERGDQSVAEAKTRAVGITMQGDPGNGGGAAVARGFGGVGSVMQLFDGDQLFVGAGTVTFPFDPWTVERIEVLGGPSSVLYGNGAIGGVVNVVPRKPNPYSRERSFRVAAGSFNTWRAAIDAAGPLGTNTSFRVDLSGNRSGGWVSENDSNSLAFSASLRHAFSPTLSLTISDDFGRQRPGEYFGTPTMNGAIDESRRDVSYNVSDADIWYRDNWTQARLEWQPRPNVRVTNGLRLLATDRHWRNVEGYTFNPATGLVDRDTYIEIFHRQRQVGDRTELTVSNPLFGRSNTFAAGFDYNYVTFRHTNNSPYGGTSVTDLDNRTPGGFINLAGTVPKYRTETHHLALFAEDRLSLSSRVSLVGGVRFDRYAADRFNLVDTSTSERVYTPASWRGGVVYAFREGFTAYGQVATATDTIGDIISNNPSSMLLDPTTGRQLEAGLKQSLLAQRVEWTFAAYHIAKDKLLTPIVGRPGEVQQVGSQSSKGIEATVSFTLPAGVRVDGNIALLDARFDEFLEEVGSTLVSRAGHTPPSVPERSANLWVTWDAPADWQFRGGLRSVGPRYWDNANTTAIPTYNVVDAGIRKRVGVSTSIDLTLRNVTDELYATDFYFNGFAPQWMLGAPRSAEVAVTVGF